MITPSGNSMYRSRGCILKVMDFKDDVGGRREADNLTRHETKLFVII